MMFYRTLVPLVLGAWWLGLCMHSEAVEPKSDRFITSLGTYSLYGGKLTIKVYKDKGKINTRMINATEDCNPAEPIIETGTSWFLYPSSVDRVWIFDGKDHLIVYEPDDTDGGESGSYVFIISDPTHNIVKRAPKEVLNRLPQSVKEKYRSP